MEISEFIANKLMEGMIATGEHAREIIYHSIKDNVENIFNICDQVGISLNYPQPKYKIGRHD